LNLWENNFKETEEVLEEVLEVDNEVVDQEEDLNKILDLLHMLFLTEHSYIDAKILLLLNVQI
jgi:hypothetical protein